MKNLEILNDELLEVTGGGDGMGDGLDFLCKWGLAMFTTSTINFVATCTIPIICGVGAYKDHKYEKEKTHRAKRIRRKLEKINSMAN